MCPNKWYTPCSLPSQHKNGRWDKINVSHLSLYFTDNCIISLIVSKHSSGISRALSWFPKIKCFLPFNCWRIFFHWFLFAKAKSPKINTTSSSETVSFQYSISFSVCSCTFSKGLLQYLIILPCRKWVTYPR